MTEYEAWTLMAAVFNSNAVFFLGCIVAVWLGFRMSNNIYEAGNPPMIAKVLTTIYCLCVAFFMFGTLSQQVSLINDFSAGFSQLAETTEISGAAQRIADTDTTVQNIVNFVFVLSIIVYQMAGVWMKKSD
jgi:TRAP-type C4-dicarboxylate transport system permease small subunit